MWKIKSVINMLRLFASTLVFNVMAEEQADFSNKIEKIDFVTLSAGRVAVRITTTQTLPNAPAGFTLNNPPRIALDFPSTGNGLGKTNITANQGDLKTISLVQAKDRSRMVLNLAKTVAYNTSVSGREVTIILQSNAVASQDNSTVEHFSEAKLTDDAHAITNVDFMRGKNGEGRVMSLTKPSYWIDLKPNETRKSTFALDLTLDENGKKKGTYTHYSLVYEDYEKRKAKKK